MRMRSFSMTSTLATQAQRLRSLAFTVLASLTVAACSSGGSVGPSAAPSAVAPQLLMTEHGLKQWDHPEAFGPVPAEWLETGKEYCATLNHGGKRFSPTGYHPHARSVEGFPFEDGGFYCTQD